MEFWPYDRFPKMYTVFPDGIEVGTAKIRHRTVDPHGSFMASLQMMKSGRGLVRDGDIYAQLMINGQLWMSDTSDERRDHSSAVWKAKGDTLIGGLGLGMVAMAMALKPEVRTVTALEINPDVITLVEPHIRTALGENAQKLKIVQADALQWKPEKGTKFDTIWMDIWLNICTDNLKEIGTLNRRFSRFLAPGGYKGAWQEARLKYDKRREQRYGW